MNINERLGQAGVRFFYICGSPQEKDTSKMNTKITLTFLLFGLVSLLTGCGGCSWREPQEGTVEVKTIYGNITRIIRPSDGGVWENWWGDDYYTVGLQNKTTEPIAVKSSSKDNAGLVFTVQVSYRTKPDDDNLKEYVRKFGLNPEEREKRMLQALSGQINTEVKNAVIGYDAYSILANQADIQKKIEDRLRPILADQFNCEFISLQIIGRPDFEDDRIEQAASAVVANQKLKEANQALLEAAKIEQEKKQVEAQTYANPALLEIRKLELQKEIAQAWAAHQGTLVFGSGGQIQIPSGK